MRARFFLSLCPAPPAAILLAVGVGLFAATAPTAPLPPAALKTVDFAADIAPIFQDSCVSCHGAEKEKAGLRLDDRTLALRGGDQGPAIVPGDSAASLLVKLVSGADEDRIMPAKGARLTAAQIGLLRAWIDQGARWPEAAAAGNRDPRLGHWALQPPQRYSPPIVSDPAWRENVIDAFVLARLETKNLKPSPEADRATLIRRMSFDLTGLPPAPDEVDAFVNDASPNALAQLVDRLLDSPRYGERWARHWLDVARFCESQGFERDKIRPHSWRYRDYVIDSLNADKPYDEFVREQIAGDVLPNVTNDRIVATGFLVAGPYDEVGLNQKSRIMRSRAREEELEDVVSVVGQTFLGLTVNCARCHSHKFDPITHEDYYRLKAVFEGVRPGDRDLRGSINPTAVKAAPKDKKKQAEGPKAYAAIPSQPKPTHRLARGDAGKPREAVSPAGLSAIAAPSPDFGLQPDAPEAQRRVRFARWITDPQNPLISRVMVNRVWSHHFGAGIVSTPNDFGFSGGRPSHPELLDRLAVEFIENRWSLKWLHKRILLSRTYRQSSAHNPTAAGIDADNRLLWRHLPRRLEAEAVRDAILAVSGQLNLRMGGPGYMPWNLRIDNTHFYEWEDKLGEDFNRRTVYRLGVQSARDPLLDSLDCPDLSTKTPVRASTTTPIQALALMNNSVVQRQSHHFAERLVTLAPGNPSAQITQAYLLAYGRPASETELALVAPAAKEHGLSTICWAIFNSSEFVYLR